MYYRKIQVIKHYLNISQHENFWKNFDY